MSLMLFGIFSVLAGEIVGMLQPELGFDQALTRAYSFHYPSRSFYVPWVMPQYNSG